MPSPSSALSTLRPDLASSLEEFDLAADRQNFIGLRAAPVIEVAKSSGNFGKIPVEQLLQTRDTKRAPGAGYARGTWTFEPANFRTDEHGEEQPVDDREATMYAEYFDAELLATARARDAVLRNLEIRLAALLFNATTWSSYTTSITHEWDDATNAVPLTDVKAAKQSVWDQCGMWPNALLINRKVFNNVRACDSVIDLIKYCGLIDPRQGRITAQVLAEAFALDYVLVGGGAKNAATEGQSVSISPIWSDEYAMVAKVASTSDPREPCVARVFHWGEDGSTIGATIESYRDEPKRSDVVRSRMDTDEVVMYVEAAHLLDNVTT